MRVERSYEIVCGAMIVNNILGWWLAILTSSEEVGGVLLRMSGPKDDFNSCI